MLYARQLGWLHAVPQRQPSRRQSGAPTPPARPTTTRMEQMQANGVQELPIPPLGPECVHMVEHWFDVGPAMPSGYGDVPLTHGEIDAWQRNCGIELPPWQASLLRRMSRGYLAERVAGVDPLRSPPWAEVSAQQKAAVAETLRRQLSLMARASKPKGPPK